MRRSFLQTFPATSPPKARCPSGRKCASAWMRAVGRSPTDTSWRLQVPLTARLLQDYRAHKESGRLLIDSHSSLSSVSSHSVRRRPHVFGLHGEQQQLLQRPRLPGARLRPSRRLRLSATPCPPALPSLSLGGAARLGAALHLALQRDPQWDPKGGQRVPKNPQPVRKEPAR